LDFLKTLPELKGVEMELEFNDGYLKYPKLIGTESECYLIRRWEITFKHLTHKIREDLMFELEECQLTYNDHELNIYSES
jgi:hypothetical protein